MKNSELFWDLLQPEYSEALMFCRKLMGNRENGDDLFQDALVTALTRIDSLREKSAFRPWLYRILVNNFRSRVRRPWWKRVLPLTPEIELTLTGDDPIEVLTARRWLDRAFEVLSTEDQALVTLHELQGWPVSDLARTFNKTEGAVKAKLFRSRRRMKDALVKFSETSVTENVKTKTNEDDRCVATKQSLD